MIELTELRKLVLLAIDKLTDGQLNVEITLQQIDDAVSNYSLEEINDELLYFYDEDIIIGPASVAYYDDKYVSVVKITRTFIDIVDGIKGSD